MPPAEKLTMKLVAACAFGLEAVVKRQLIALGYAPQGDASGRVAFEGDWTDVCKANLWLRSADRVLIELMKFDCADFDQLYDTVKAFRWADWITVDGEFPVTGRSRKSKLTSVPAVQRTAKKAIVESLQRDHGQLSLPETGPTWKIDVALLDDVATLTLDTTGPGLNKRGYRKLTGHAPIRETLAAALVELSVWKPERVLVDPFCGTGTIPIEAAMIALKMAPGLHREFASSTWPQIPETSWNEARETAAAERNNDLHLQISGFDIDNEALEMARYHVAQAGVADQIHFQQKSFSEFRSSRQYGCIVTNPPYGERLGEVDRQLEALYASFPAVVQRVPTWSLFLLTSLPNLEKIFGRKATRRRKLFNGRIECQYYQYLGPRPPKGFVESPVEKEDVVETGESVTMTEASESVTKAPAPIAPATTQSPAAKPVRPEIAPVFGGLQPKDKEQGELFASRLAKRARHLRRWPTKRGITCFRIYDRDIPEIPLVVERLENNLHITEYERPHDRDAGRHAQWLELMVRTASQTLDVPIQRTHLKSRIRQLSQYEKVASHKQLIPVTESGLTFLLNLTDYVDTGLFLDHRQTRQMVRELADGKRFLNLFAYTGSFTVYAASGGATSTTTVDLSANYIDWAKQNLTANQLSHNRHQFIVSDTMEYLNAAAARGDRFDLCVVDPPTFSNSKRADDWDVQTMHSELLNRIAVLMAPGGKVFFSTNFRRFKLDESGLVGFAEIREISKQTVPEDFRNQRIHRCWRLVADDN